MSAPDAFIDLGEGHGEVADRPWVPRRRRTRRLARWRSVLALSGWSGRVRVAALAAALVLGLAAGGAARTEPPLRLVGRVHAAAGGSLMIDTGRLMVLDGDQALAAYALRGGQRLWRAQLGMPVAYGSMAVSDGVVLVSADITAGGGMLTAAIDEATGRVLWRSPSTLFVPLAGTGTVLLQPLVDARLDLVDVRTGTPRWSGSFGDCQFSFDVPQVPPTPHAIALLCGSDRLELVDLPTGTERSVDLPPIPGTAAGAGSQSQLLTAGDVMVVERLGGGPPMLEAYRWSDGARVWSRPGYGADDLLYPCGRHVCVRDGGDGGMVLDPVSGASVDAPLGPDPRLPVQPDFIRVTSSVGGSPELKVLLLVPAGHPVPVTVSAASAFPAQVAGPVAVTWAGPAAVVRPGPPATNWPTRTFPVLEQAPGRTLVEVVGADGTVRPLQWLDGIAPSSCTALVTYLICPTSSTTATVWQFPDRP